MQHSQETNNLQENSGTVVDSSNKVDQAFQKPITEDISEDSKTSTLEVKTPSDQERNGKDSQGSNSSSEIDLRAAAMREQIEQKLEQIEAEIQLQTLNNQGCNDEEPFLENDENQGMLIMQTFKSRRSRSYSLAEMKETAIARLQEELDNAQKELKLKGAEVAKLSKVRNDMGAEIEELTACLFEEANNMVRDANVRAARAERQSKEANMKLSILQEEVTALKTLVQNAIPLVPSYKQSLKQTPNVQQTPQKKTLFRRTPQSNNNNSIPGQRPDSCTESDGTPAGPNKEHHYEPDPMLHSEFVSWRQNPVIDKNHSFLKRIYVEDIGPCMNFENQDLADKVLCSIEANRITVERVPVKSHVPKVCALLNAPRFCHYRMNLDEEEDYYISTLSRNRIAAICDFFCYLRYIEKGFIKHSLHEVYMEILKKRNAINIARLGIIQNQ